MAAASSNGKKPSARRAPDERLARVERAIGYRFRDKKLLTLALTHRSVLQTGDDTDQIHCNERLEFLGDAVLSLAISADLMRRASPTWDEGDLSRIRAALVNAETLADIARELDLGESLVVGRGERKDGGAAKTSILANTLEAIFGAVHEDRGYEVAAGVIANVFAKRLSSPLTSDLGMDYKTLLQERIQDVYRVAPEYRVLAEAGPAHEREFEIQVLIDGHPVARGRGIGKKRASQDAARAALRRLQTLGGQPLTSLDDNGGIDL